MATAAHPGHEIAPSRFTGDVVPALAGDGLRAFSDDVDALVLVPLRTRAPDPARQHR
jgi:hypothetical protein